MSDIADHWRKGQIAFNVLSAVDPRAAREILASDIDPYYRDENLDRFWEWLMTRYPMENEA